MSQFPFSEKISRVSHPMIWSKEKNELMVLACREMALFHYENSKEIKLIYDKNKFSPSSILDERDLANIPSLGVTAMKYYLITSLPHEKAVLKLTSSGTSGQKTQIWFDEESLARVQGMLDVLWEEEGLVSQSPTNYADFIYDVEQAKDLGIAFSVKNEQRFAPVNRSYFTVKKNSDGHWAFQTEETIQTLKSYQKEGLPVRILGIPSFIFELLTELKKRGPILLPQNSYVLTGGGWKAAEDKKVTREEFRKLITQYLGIPDQNIRDGYGMAEHSAPYIECKDHRFHVPVYNRIYSKDPITLKTLPPGEVGLLQFITPFNAMMPTLSLLSTDLGYLDAIPCSCGLNSPTFTLVGRGGLSKHKGCAITATEIVKRTV